MSSTIIQLSTDNLIEKDSLRAMYSQTTGLAFWTKPSGVILSEAGIGPSEGDQDARGMPALIRYSQENRERFGNPEINALNRAVDLTWNAYHKLALTLSQAGTSSRAASMQRPQALA
jgi:hypothetical protein